MSLYFFLTSEEKTAAGTVGKESKDERVFRLVLVFF